MESGDRKSYGLGPPDDTDDDFDVHTSDQNSVGDDYSHVEMPVGDVDYTALSIAGMDLTVNGKFEEAMQLFKQHETQSPLMAGGVAFVHYFTALISFEEQKTANAKAQVVKCLKLCKLFLKMSQKQSMQSKQPDHLVDSSDRWAAVCSAYTCRIVIADCYAYFAVLTSCNMDMHSYIKAGWYLRKSYKLYESVYKELKAKTDSDMTPEVRSRLLSATSFGYGTFHLTFSMIPPNLLSFLEMFGFPANRNDGLEALEFCLHNSETEMRAPFALLGLLWYYVFVKPFITISDADIEKCMLYAESLLSEYAGKYERESVFFSLIRARLLRMTGKLNDSIALCEHVMARADLKMVELALMMRNEAAWCHLACLDYKQAGDQFQTIHGQSRWSKLYYLYPVALCAGAQGDTKRCKHLVSQMKKAKARQGSQVELFVQTHARLLAELGCKREVCELLVLELLYHWDVLYVCPEGTLARAHALFATFDGHKDLDALTCFLQGVVYGSCREELDQAEVCLLASRHPKSNSKHLKLLPPYSCIELAWLVAKRGGDSGVREATAYLTEARDKYKNFDFEHRVQVIVHNVLESFKEGNET